MSVSTAKDDAQNTHSQQRAGRTAVVVGGGIAGVAAATVLAERGVTVTLIESEQYLGGRAGAWTDRLASGENFDMERGFHAFFRQYYNLKALLRRIDPDLAFLEPLEDYPIIGPGGQVQTFSDLPRRAPYNVISLTARTPTLGFRDLMRVNKRRALEMLTFDANKTYDRRDTMSAKAYLDSLNFPPDARQLLFDVFAHSFFNPEADMSAAELLMMFHFYFMGNPEGLIFDVTRSPFSRSIWGPFGRYLEGLGATVELGTAARRVERQAGTGWLVETDKGRNRADGVVVAVHVPALQGIVDDSPDLDDGEWRTAVAGLALTRPFVVWRLWLDRPTEHGRAPFVGTTGLGPIDNISLYHLFQDESRDWAARRGGSVVELHAYAVEENPAEEKMKEQLLGALHHVYPETREAKIIEERYLVRQDCPAFAPNAYAKRPGVDTPYVGIAIAGDFVKCAVPSALMERAAATGFIAANTLLSGWGMPCEPIASVPERGMLSRLPI